MLTSEERQEIEAEMARYPTKEVKHLSAVVWARMQHGTCSPTWSRQGAS